MLLRLYPALPRCLFTEMEKLPDPKPEFGDLPVFS